MAHLWKETKNGNEQEREWALAVLDAHDRFHLKNHAVQAVQAESDNSGMENGTVILIRSDSKSGKSQKENWLLMSKNANDVSVNGIPLMTGIKELSDRDEIMLKDAGRFFFSGERLARKAPLPELGRKVFCPRCKQEIETGTTAVRCPNPDCSVWHHETEELPCWTYAEKCALCDQNTDLNSGYRWTPETL